MLLSVEPSRHCPLQGAVPSLCVDPGCGRSSRLPGGWELLAAVMSTTKALNMTRPANVWWVLMVMI